MTTTVEDTYESGTMVMTGNDWSIGGFIIVFLFFH